MPSPRCVPQSKTLRGNWGLIAESLDGLQEGISVFNRDLVLVLFNRRFVETLDFPPSLVRIGARFEELIRYNAGRGEYGPGDPEQQVRERVERALRFEPHALERVRPNGRVIEIRGNPVRGGFVTVYTDISERRRLEARLQEMASTDALTGILNRRRLLEVLEQEVAQARRYRRWVSLLMLDADRFKSINDSFGHLAGDRALETLVGACRRQLRDVDAFGRYGGEEFVILLPETDLEAARGVAERLRETAAAAEVSGEHPALRCTVSIGVASAWGRASAADDLIRRADAALYCAKLSGRNQVQCAPEPLRAAEDLD